MPEKQRSVLRVQKNTLTFQSHSYRCAIGKSGFSDHKKEGDGCTPLGAFPLRECWYRADRLAAPQTALPLRAIKEDDGWCDDPKSREYNRHFRHPGVGRDLILQDSKASQHEIPAFAGMTSYEHLWRSDHRYDLIVPFGYNDDPVVPGKGSAIFLHVAGENYKPTEGCVALALPDLLEILKLCDSRTMMEIREK